ncbi:IS110 family transposase, partial [Acidomonas methanolica]|uniref:IS110 family transposase n=1 Tax=Acidomonas methanolica TaxID=437 RepID=UPI00211A0B88
TLTMPQSVIGCDLSRAFLDLCDLPAGRMQRIPNTRDAIAEWAETLTPEKLVVFEATSGCDDILIATLTERAHPFSRVNPRQAREFARATGVLAKTDRVDARVLAQMGAALDLPVTRPVSPARATLADFLRRRRQLVDMRKAKKLRRHSAGHDDIAEQINAMIAADRTLADQAALMRAVPGIGPTVLAILLGELPELGTLCRRKIASLAGLAPHSRESGIWKGAMRIWSGRRKVREALYIAALSACLHSSPCATGCAPRARHPRPSLSPSRASFPSSSMP